MLKGRILTLARRMLFFFQAEDGIRDGRVTGVQTCALPIYSPGELGCEIRRMPAVRRPGSLARAAGHPALPQLQLRLPDCLVGLALARVRAAVRQPGRSRGGQGPRRRPKTVASLCAGTV